MSAKIYVGNLGWNTSDSSLREVFEKYGSILESTIMRDRATGRCRGFGYVTYSSTDEAEAAIHDFNKQELDGRRVKVVFASNHPGDGSNVPIEVSPGDGSKKSDVNVAARLSQANNSSRDPSISLPPSLSPLFVIASFGLAIVVIGNWLLW